MKPPAQGSLSLEEFSTLMKRTRIELTAQFADCLPSYKEGYEDALQVINAVVSHYIGARDGAFQQFRKGC